MLATDGYIADKVTEVRTRTIAAEVARAAPPHLATRSHIRNSRGATWLGQQACRLLTALGWGLVAVGRWLERYGQPQPALRERKAETAQ